MQKVSSLTIIAIMMLLMLGLAPIRIDADTTLANTEELIKTREKSEDASAVKVEKIIYQENNWLNDFEIHFFVSLPFTALYSYIAVSSIDAIVQGQYPTSFRTTNSWIIAGLAVGSSLAIALGSTGRVVDQSIPRKNANLDWREAELVLESKVITEKMEFIKILY